MNTQIKLRHSVVLPTPLKVGDRVEIAGPSRHVGIITEIKDSPYSGLSYSVKFGSNIRLDRIAPEALTKL